MTVGETIAAATPIRHALDEPTAAEAGKVVRQGLAGDAEDFGQISGVAGGFAQSEEHAGAGRVGQCMPQTCDSGCVGQRCESGRHALDDTENREFMYPCIQREGARRRLAPPDDQRIAYTALPMITATTVVQPMMAMACQKRMRAFPMPEAASIVAVNCVGSRSGPSRLTPGTP